MGQTSPSQRSSRRSWFGNRGDLHDVPCLPREWLQDGSGFDEVCLHLRRGDGPLLHAITRIHGSMLSMVKTEVNEMHH